MAPVPASLPSAPSGMSSVFATIGDRKQIIVYAAIVIIFLVVFFVGVIYILRSYNASDEDEESNTTSTPRPPLRLLLPSTTPQRTTSSTSTLVGNVALQQTLPSPVKSLGGIPSPLGQHVHTEPASVVLEQAVAEDVPTDNNERPDKVISGVAVVIPEGNPMDAEKIISPQLEVDITDNKVPILKVDPDVTDMMVLTLKDNKQQATDAKHESGDIADQLTDVDAVNIGNVFLQMEQDIAFPKALKSSAMSATSLGAKSATHSSADSGCEGRTSVTTISYKSAKCGLLPFRQEPPRGDLWAAALDRLARHVTLEDHDPENPPIRDIRVREAPHKFIKEDSTSDHTLRHGMVNPPEPSIGSTPSTGDEFELSETPVPASGISTDYIDTGHPYTKDVPSALSHEKSRKEVRFAGDFKAEVGDHCRISYDEKAPYLKVKVASPIAPLLPLSNDDPPLPHLVHLADLALGPADRVPDIGESCGSLAPSTDSCGPTLATESSSEGSFTSPPIVPASLSVLGIDDDEYRPIIVVEDHLDENADRNFYELGISYSTQALRNLVMKDAERAREREEEEQRRREEVDNVYASFRERRRQRRLGDSPATAYTPPLTPDLGDSDSAFSSPASGSPLLDAWSPPASPPLPPTTNRASTESADFWTFLPGNTGDEADLAFSASGNLRGLGLQIQYRVGDDVPLPPRRALVTSPSDDEMKPILVVEDHLDENAERNFYEFGISYSTQALRNLLMKDCEKASERRRLEYAAGTSTSQAQKMEQPAGLMDGLGLGDDSLREAVNDNGDAITQGAAPVALLSDTVLPPHGVKAAQEASPIAEVSHRIVRDSSCKASEYRMSVQDRATQPGRFSKLLISFYNGYDFDVAAAIAVGLEVNIEDCDIGNVVTLSDNEEYPVSAVLSEEPPTHAEEIESSSALHLLVPKITWSAPRL
ncbi:hypothetical protein DAEQUDRAFT_758352 [Daedalea quercina L-15889]|uniref:Uncharacterized protein n=1 Tax=Daedalea quercina L-15889 TaxID=1314783 RepID=A0A165NKH9_9APHY|nr:hypothetical protein DAEQUDRAFT_758352 [Daedalea quercina L-15889]